jgi:hypothetical protein
VARKKPESWYLLVHQLPPRPLYLRAKVRQRLARVGALSLKNSVYVLPARDECREDLGWIAQEARAEGGEAFVCRGEFVDGVDPAELVQRFQRAAAERYAAVRRQVAALTGRSRPAAVPPASLARLRRAVQDARETDFFGAPGGKEVEAMLKKAESRSGGAAAPGPRAPAGALGARTWVTRRDVHVDRIATAWLVRRFLNPRARFRFVDPDQPGPARRGEVRFDMPGGDFTHEGDRCTLETVLRQAGLRDEALARVAEVVHDLDLKDDKFGRAEAAGLRQILAGLYARHPDDQQRLEAGFQVFDNLYASFQAGSRPAARKRPAPGRRRRR